MFSININAGLLNQALKKVAFAAQTCGYERPVLQGVCLDFSIPNKLMLIATNGFRLAYSESKVIGEFNPDNSTYTNLTIPSDFVDLILAVTKRIELTHEKAYNQYLKERQIRLSIDYTNEYQTPTLKISNNTAVDADHIVWSYANWSYSALCHKNFPKWKQIIPTKFKGSIIANVNSLLAAIKAVPIEPKRRNGSVINLMASGNTLALSRGDDKQTPQSLFIELASEDRRLFRNHDTFSAYVNAIYLREGITNTIGKSTSTCAISFNSPEEPILVTDHYNKSSQYLLMPCRKPD